MKQESLLPPQAITKGTIEWTSYHGKHLVRYKDLDGNVHSTTTNSPEEANAAYDRYLAHLKDAKQKGHT